MHANRLFVLALIVVVGMAMFVGSIALGEPSSGSKPAEQPDFQLPPGWTPADLQAMIDAGTPGKEHEFLAESVGQWQGKTIMQMSPGGQSAEGECTVTVTPMLDGRFTKTEITGEIPGMGPYHGFGISGFDKVSGEFVSSWIDNHGTGVMNGVGELSADQKTLTWEFGYNCPVTKKQCKMREVVTFTGPDTQVLEMFGAEPKSGEVYKMMRIELTRK